METCQHGGTGAVVVVVAVVVVDCFLFVCLLFVVVFRTG